MSIQTTTIAQDEQGSMMDEQRSMMIASPSGVSPDKGEMMQSSRAQALTTCSRILIVEDELWSALDMEWVVHKTGREVVGIAATAEQAIEMAQSTHPDLIQMDIRLSSQRDGIEAAVEILQRFGISSLFVTAHCDPQTRQRAALAEPAGFIEKPFTPDALKRAIEAAINRRNPEGSGDPDD